MLHEIFYRMFKVKKPVMPVKIVLAGIVGKHAYLFCRESNNKGNGFQSVHILDLNNGYPVVQSYKTLKAFCKIVSADLSIHFKSAFSVEKNEMNNEQIMLAVYTALLENTKKLEEL